MKTIAKKIFTAKTGVLTFLAGAASLFIPHLSGWNEIVFPSFALIGTIFYFLWKIFFAISIALSLLNLLALFLLKTSGKTKMISALFLAGLIALFLSIYPNFASKEHLGIDQRISFFAVGGQTRIVWAGGLETIKSDALALLEQQPDDEGFVNSNSWANSLKKLGAVAVRIDNKTQSVIVYISKAEMFDPDQFGYLFTNEKETSPNVLNHGDNNRLWKLTDGVYFFETW